LPWFGIKRAGRFRRGAIAYCVKGWNYVILFWVDDDYGSKYRVEIFSGASGRVLKEPFNPDYQERQSHCSTPTLVTHQLHNFCSICEAEENDDPESRDINNEAFWIKLQSIFQQTAEMIREIADEMGIDVNSLDSDYISEELSIQEAAADNHELTRSARYYGKMIDTWFDSENSMFERRQDELNTLLEIGMDEDKQHTEADSIYDARDPDSIQ
jgi:hypothetical protein